jgi:hypothetical protein
MKQVEQQQAAAALQPEQPGSSTAMALATPAQTTDVCAVMACVEFITPKTIAVIGAARVADSLCAGKSDNRLRIAARFLPLNYSPIGRHKWLSYKEKQRGGRENISDLLVANATICSR